MKEFKVQTDDSGIRADVFIAGQYPQFSRSSLQRLFDDRLVAINDEPAKASVKVQEKDVVSVDDSLLHANPPAISLPIIYEDDDVIVINKPSGLLTHSKGALNTEATVASFIKPKLTDSELMGNRAGIVHRLDRQTSGVIITAKNTMALKWLQKQFSARKAKKTYIAIVEGIIDPSIALIDAPITRSPKRPQTFIVSASGKPAQTEYEVDKKFIKGTETYSKVILRPQTGRTHQLRVHMAYINHPIVGDSVYGHKGEEILLHAYRLELTLPSHQRQVFEAPIPDKISGFDG